ncbi:hypothetical protein GpartN1_g6.t1 [Galdieria partita]|uniref:MOSC domain-containing protein n=1 Tax=Galdieria partita TaxID=83374 RepID=A0A9C7ULZ1_9RHOD|nr:hypothetical protein GpartN1_g6.t1 [Galdieria partita]
MDFVYPRENVSETSKNVVYLDTAGFALYSLSQINDCHKLLERSSFVNPHSVPRDFPLFQRLERVRERVLQFFGTTKDTYDVVFTSGATAGLKLVGENFQWKENSGLIYLTDCHTSALGIRDYAASAGSSIYPVDRNWCKAWFASHTVEFIQHRSSEENLDDGTYALFAYTGESNFCGTRYQLKFCQLVHEHGLFQFRGKNILTLVDAAKLAAAHPIVLDEHPDVDILVVSFYKIFGYPTGVGCLLIRKHCPRIQQTLCSKRYYRGGTILIADAYNDLHTYPKNNNSSFHESWEDGTINFLEILVSLPVSINWVEHTIGGMQFIENHIEEIYDYARDELLKLTYPNGQSIIHIYEEDVSFSSSSFCGRGNSIITFNVFQPDGRFISHFSVYCAFLSNHILVRSGMLCNPGSCQYYFGLRADEISNMAQSSSSCWDPVIGAVRISFGIHSVKEDVTKLLDTLKQLCQTAWQNNGLVISQILGGNVRDISSSSNLVSSKTRPEPTYLVDKIFVYPLKGCRGMPVIQWPISSNGLLYDRKYCLVNTMTYSLLSIRNYPKLAALKVSIYLSKNEMQDSFIAQFVFEIADSVQVVNVPRVYILYERDLRQQYTHCWLSTVLQIPCQLMTVEEFESSSCFRESKRIKGKYRNDAHLLVIHSKSVAQINECLRKKNKSPVPIEAFRPNLVVKDEQKQSTGNISESNERITSKVRNRLMLPLEEDKWSDFACLYNKNNSEKILKLRRIGDCVRCMTICIDLETGELREDREPWLLLSTYRMAGAGEKMEKNNELLTKELTRQRGPVFGCLYNVSTESDSVNWIKVEEFCFEGGLYIHE